MKTLIKLLVLIAIPVCTSCSEWLNVNPQTQVKETELFEEEYGFKTALTGAYILLAEEELYGKTMSFYLPELLARHWYFGSSELDQLYRLSHYDFESQEEEETLFGELWINYYKVIAQLNNILDFADKTAATFHHNNDLLVKGEALGLRAFLHLELFRLFAPHPEAGNLQRKAIPYLKEMTRDANALVSIEAAKVIEYIESDLDAAEALLKESDPILEYTNNQLNSFTGETRPEDDWQMHRQSRFNYYAVLATKARFYHWTGQADLAMKYATAVIESGKFELSDADAFDAEGNLVNLSENIFNVVNADHQDIVENAFIDQFHQLKLDLAHIESCFESSVNPNDHRGKIGSYWAKSPDYEDNDGQRYYSYLKYYGSQDIKVTIANTIPLIRLSEMYFILMELKPLGDAKQYFYDWRVTRLLTSSADNDFDNENSRRQRIEKEFRKEFFGEGQMFYFYKRLNYTTLPFPDTFTLPSTELYTLPKPEGQLNYELF